MVCKKSIVSKILVILVVLIFLFHCSIRCFADGPYVAQYDVFPFYFAKGNFTVYCEPNDANITHFDFVCDSPEDTYTLLFVDGLGLRYYPYSLTSPDSKISVYMNQEPSTYIRVSYQDCNGDKGFTFYNQFIATNRSLFTDYYAMGYTMEYMFEKFREFVDLGYAEDFKDSTIVDTSLVRNDINYGLQNVNASCVDNELTLNWSGPYSLPDALEYPVLIDLLIEDRDTGESAIYYYPETESIFLRPSPCDITDLTYSFDVGNIKDIPENFYIKSVSLTPCYIVHLEYLDMDVTYRGQTSHVFLNYSGTDRKPIYEPPIIQLPPDTEIIEEDMPTSIFGAISNFFSGFFNNFGTMLKNLFIPTKEQMQSLFADMESFFSDKLGFLWFPFDLAITIVETFTYGDADSIITVPSISLNILGGIDLYGGGQFDMDAVGIFPYVRMVSSLVLACSVAGLAYNKWDEWIGGHDK